MNLLFSKKRSSQNLLE